MTKEKTALTQLIESLNQLKITSLSSDSVRGGDYRIGLTMAIHSAKELLPIEKQQIVDAVADPFLGSRPEGDAKQIGENYYKTTFNK